MSTMIRGYGLEITVESLIYIYLSCIAAWRLAKLLVEILRPSWAFAGYDGNETFVDFGFGFLINEDIERL